MNIDNLNNKQKEAVLYNDGPLLILAGAGSGKTKVLTTKIAYLIEEKNISPYQILAITFTNKAAMEMKERIHNLIGSTARNIQISTFHSFGLKLIRENATALGYDANFSIMDSDDSLTIIKKIMKDMNLDPKVYNPKAIKSKISSCKNEMITPEKFERYAVSEYEQKVLEIYIKYQKKLKSSNAMDFDDLLNLPIELFKGHPSILEKYQERFQYVLIDEYQDTNEPQYILSKMMSAKYRNICVVGDDSQAIFSWRGANYQKILNFEKDYQNAKVIMLEQNYRSTKKILDAANCVIKNNKQRKEKNLWTENEEGENIKYYRAYDGKDEAHYVCHMIAKLREKGVTFENMAVLYRTNAQSRTIEEELLKDNIPYHIVGGFSFYSRREIKDLLAYLKLIHNPKDNVSLLRVINTPKRGIGLKSIEALTEKADRENISLFDAISGGKEGKFKEVIEKLIEIKEEISLTELVEKVLDSSGLKQELESEKSLEADIRLENLEEFKSITMAFEAREGEISLEDFLFEVSLVSDKDEYDSENGKVSLMTVHSVKGLEYDYVFIIGMEEGLFPHMNSLMESGELEEERRLCYVAITRARKDLYIVNARRRVLFGKDQINPPSRFIGEIDANLIESNVMEERCEKEESIVIGDMFREEEVDYQVGDYVYHESFGTGRVVEVTNTLVSVAFKHPYGIRKLMKNHKKLSKV